MRTKCNLCNGEGGSIHPDGLSSETCEKCNGIGENHMEIKFIWNGNFVGTDHTLIVNGIKHRLCGPVSDKKESAIEAVTILKEKYNIDYPIDDIKWEWGGCL